MIGIVALQLALNLVCLGALLYQLKARREPVTAGVGVDESAALRAHFESRLAHLDDALKTFHSQASEQLRAVARLGDEAMRLLKKSQVPWPAHTPTAEECELRAALTVESGNTEEQRPKISRIPTLSDLEKTHQRLKSDISVDLKTLLKDQLA